MITQFKNEPFTDFKLISSKWAVEKALQMVESQKQTEYPLIIGGEKIYTNDKTGSINPSKSKEIVGAVSNADVALAEKAVQTAATAFNQWKHVSPSERANYLFKAAAIMRRRKFEFSAWLVQEAGKTWPEADGDTAEAIDFLEYYGRQMLILSSGAKVVEVPEENNECHYTPLGVGVVIAPWNFPLAILVGMTASAIVAGNTVIMKPAAPTLVIAAKFMEIWEEIALPAGVVNFLPGPGSVIGDYLVGHPMVRFINFTGSKDVGLRINKTAADIAPGQKWIKRVVAEMGGKDAIIVDSEADLEDAASGIVASAFGFQGQKCSACSRAIIDEAVYDEMLERIVEKTKKLQVGLAEDLAMDMGPVIDEKSYKKILEYIEIGKTEGRLLTGGKSEDNSGYYIMPTIIADVDPKARIAQEEIFGPVLAVIKAKHFDEALEIANNTEYGLTGAVYSKNRMKLEQAKRDFYVGNLYLNRKCTGALVGVNPFGGFNMSGTDSKAGGPDYLTLFMQLKTLTERY